MKTALTWINAAPMEFWVICCLLSLGVVAAIALSAWAERTADSASSPSTEA